MTLSELIKSKDTVWLFDYDLTLYGYDEKHVLGSMDEYITQYIVDFLKISAIQANDLRRDYWKQYGTTLNGLRAYYDIDPDNYFDFIHSGEKIKKPKYNPEMRKNLEKINGQRWVFTNGRRDWAVSGLESIGVFDLFKKIFDIEFFKWSGKPYPEVYQQVLDYITPQNGAPIVFLDDKLDNIETAHSFGWTTIWMTEEPTEQHPADYVFTGVRELFMSIDV